MFRMEFETENEAFSDGNAAAEIWRILREIASRVASGYTSGKVRDTNGNSVGTWEVEP